MYNAYFLNLRQRDQVLLKISLIITPHLGMYFKQKLWIMESFLTFRTSYGYLQYLKLNLEYLVTFTMVQCECSEFKTQLSYIIFLGIILT